MRCCVGTTIAFLVVVGFCNCENKVLSTVVLFRHGDRTPYFFVPNDPYKDEKYWPVGYGQLTATGKRQHFEFGQWLRNRYDGFLPQKYSEKDIYVRSTDLDRTLMSAAANLAGLYPPIESQKWNKDLDWQPIPIHTMPTYDDQLVALAKTCKKYDTRLAELANTTEYQQIWNENIEFIEYLRKYTGFHVQTLVHFADMVDAWYIEDLYGYPLPDYLHGVYPDKFKPIVQYAYRSYTYTPELKLLKTGPFFYNILTHFNNYAYGDPSSSDNEWDRKFIMLSAHDSTIMAILNSLGLWDGEQPPYASSIIFDLILGIDAVYYMNILYKRSPTDIVKLSLPGCEFDCPYDKFLELVTPISMTMKQWEVECNS